MLIPDMELFLVKSCICSNLDAFLTISFQYGASIKTGEFDVFPSIPSLTIGRETFNKYKTASQLSSEYGRMVPLSREAQDYVIFYKDFPTCLLGCKVCNNPLKNWCRVLILYVEIGMV